MGRLRDAKGVKLAYHRIFNLRVGEVKVSEIAVQWEPRHALLKGHGTHLTLNGVGLDELMCSAAIWGTLTCPAFSSHAFL